MNTVQLIPMEHTVHVFDEKLESANGIPSIASFFRTIYDGMWAWYRDNYEGKINAVVQLFGSPFSIASNLFNIVLRVYQVSAILGLKQTSSLNFFRPMALSGLCMAVLESFYHLYGLTFQLNFAYNFYRLKDNPQEYFSYLFHNFLGINEREHAEILHRLQEEGNYLGEIRARGNYFQQRKKIRLAKMIPLARRISPWLVKDITTTLSKHPEGVSQEQAKEWMDLIEIQMAKKLLVHVIAIVTIFTLGAGLILALSGAAPVLSLALLSVSPIFTVGQYLFECGLLNSYRWEFSWINCVPLWMRWISDTLFDTHLEFTPGKPRQHPVTA